MTKYYFSYTLGFIFMIVGTVIYYYFQYSTMLFFTYFSLSVLGEIIAFYSCYKMDKIDRKTTEEMSSILASPLIINGIILGCVCGSVICSYLNSLNLNIYVVSIIFILSILVLPILIYLLYRMYKE